MAFNFLWCRESQNAQQRYELCKLLASLLLSLAAFSEAVGVTGVSTARQMQWEICFFPLTCNLGKPPIRPCAKKCRSQTCSGGFTLLKEQL